MAELTAAEEWLPPGWTAEVKVRNNGKKDWFYIDPSKAHKFKSKPEVLRYLKSLESIPESEGKRRSSRNRPSVDSPAEAERVNVADSGTNGKIDDQTVNRTDTLKGEKILESSAGGKEISLLNQKEKNKSRNGEYDLAMVTEAPPQNMPGVEKTGNKRLQIGNAKSKNNGKKPDLPRRASKRLAGVEVGPIPELSPTNRTRRVSARQVDDTDAATSKSSLDNTKSTAVEDNKHDCSSEGGSMPKETNLHLEANTNNNNKSDDVAGASLEVPLHDIWKDPCIEFAIKTLTGQIPIEEVLGQKKPPTEIPKSSAELPSGDLWGDPCIEFAVKTLTGDIPLDGLSFQNHFQKRDKSSGFSLGSGSVSNSDSLLTSGFPPFPESK